MGGHEPEQVGPDPGTMRDAVIVQGEVWILQRYHYPPPFREEPQGRTPEEFLFGEVHFREVGVHLLGYRRGVLFYPALVVRQLGNKEPCLQLLVGLVPDRWNGYRHRTLDHNRSRDHVPVGVFGGDDLRRPALAEHW